MPVERIRYPALREMTWQQSAAASNPDPNFYTLDYDDRVRHSEGKFFTLYATERTFYSGRGSASATDFYNTDQGPKATLYHRVSRSPYRYGAMRASSAGREVKASSPACATTERVGPGTYHVGNQRVPPPPRRRDVGSAVFASATPRLGKEWAVPPKTAEPVYSSLSVDRKSWTSRGNKYTKGMSFGSAQRFKRAPGPGTNLPAQVPVPGPGAYCGLHSWPDQGFNGTARGYNYIALPPHQ
ncbi:hypothetical protein AB1Y20_001937 [Prymnesium parvum]|uniref:Uncharacterized protein n=1 Tax=Prymnesium parvum TaxID=97485 RepID=A0AB34J8X5_PRYPA